MRLRLPRTTRVFERGAPIELSGGPVGVLVLHGWTGWTGRVAFLASRLHEAGFTVSVPRLPGHGTLMADLLGTSADDWLRRGVDAYLDLAARCERVFIAGTSMGGVLAVIIAEHFGSERVALLAPAFLTRNRLVSLAAWLRWLVHRVPGGWREEEEADDQSRALGREYATWNYTSLVAQLVRVQRAGRRALRSLTARTLVVVSLADRTVPPEVADYVRDRSKAASFRAVTVERSNHQIAEHADREEVATAVIEWFSREA